MLLYVYYTPLYKYCCCVLEKSTVTLCKRVTFAHEKIETRFEMSEIKTEVHSPPPTGKRTSLRTLVPKPNSRGAITFRDVVTKPKSKRSRNGCSSCKKLKIKCNEDKPYCEYCVQTGRQCIYEFKQNASKIDKKEKPSRTNVQINTKTHSAASDLAVININDKRLRKLNSMSCQLNVTKLELKLLKYYIEFGPTFLSYNVTKSSFNFWCEVVPKLWCTSDLVKTSLYAVSSARLLASYGTESNQRILIEDGEISENSGDSQGICLNDEAAKYMEKTTELIELYQIVLDNPTDTLSDRQDILGQLLIAKKLNTGSLLILPRDENYMHTKRVKDFAIFGLMCSTHRFFNAFQVHIPILNGSKYSDVFDPEIIPNEDFDQHFKNVPLCFVKHLETYVSSKISPSDVLQITYLDAICRLENGCNQAIYFTYPVALLRTIIYLSIDMDFIKLLEKEDHLAMKIMFYVCSLNSIFHYKFCERSGIHNELLTYYKEYSNEKFKDNGGWEDEVDKNIYSWVVARSQSVFSYDMGAVRYIAQPFDEFLKRGIPLSAVSEVSQDIF